MLITKVGLTVVFAAAGLCPFSMSQPPAQTDPAGSVQSTTYEQFLQTADVGYFAGVEAEF